MSNRRLLTFYFCIAGALFAVRLFKGDGPLDAASFALGWSIASTAVLAATRMIKRRRGESCALCDDLPLPDPAARDR